MPLSSWMQSPALKPNAPEEQPKEPKQPEEPEKLPAGFRSLSPVFEQLARINVAPANWLSWLEPFYNQPVQASTIPVQQTTTPITPTTPPDIILPQPGEGIGESTGPVGQPTIIEVGGQTFWWNPTGGVYGTGGWDVMPKQGLTPEQQAQQAEADRQAALIRANIGVLSPEQQIQQAEAERQAQMERLRTQYELERQMQAAQAAQQMAQMYAADPYKYWAQLGQGTPEAVSRLTQAAGQQPGGAILPGQQMRQIPLSTPSAQWWGNLLPSEQQQIAGGLNWLGINPEDWYSMYQRTIPGLNQRQVEPQWAR